MSRFDRELPEYAAKDPLGPPKEPVDVRCLHCDHVFNSDEMLWYRGMWCCPKISCGGAGFLFDIFPTASVFWRDDGADLAVDEWGVMSLPCDPEMGDEIGEMIPPAVKFH